MHFRSLILALPLAPLLFGCAAIQLAPGAEQVRITNSEPQGCQLLGEVVGSQGNAVSGAWTSNDNLVMGARNDLKNKAAALGGNVVHLLSNTTGQSWGQNGGGTTSSHLMGAAYRCPDAGAAAPASLSSR